MALTANSGTTLQGKFGNVQLLQVAAGVHIYRGAIVATIVSGTSEGYATPTADNAAHLVEGWAMEEADNESGIDGAKTVRVQTNGNLKINYPNCIQTAVGKLALVLDDETVQLYGTSTNKIVVGRISALAVVGSSVWVNFGMRPKRVSTSATD